jgi:hypothetical protein
VGVPEQAWLWGPASTSWRWLSKNLTGISPPVNADIPTDIQVHFVDEFDAHANPTGVAAAVANAALELQLSYAPSPQGIRKALAPPSLGRSTLTKQLAH